MFERIKLKGKVTIIVFDKDGRKIKRTSHNIVTSVGDALLANWVSGTSSKSLIDSTHGYIGCGTGWTGNSPKSNTDCNTPTGVRRLMDSGYPVTKGVFGSTDDNVVVYRVTFPAGSLNASGINEACLMNALTAGECLAYAQITPEVNVTINDTLQIEWEITFLGS
jgi:hypothetical protein